MPGGLPLLIRPVFIAFRKERQLLRNLGRRPLCFASLRANSSSSSILGHGMSSLSARTSRLWGQGSLGVGPVVQPLDGCPRLKIETQMLELWENCSTSNKNDFVLFNVFFPFSRSIPISYNDPIFH